MQIVLGLQTRLLEPPEAEKALVVRVALVVAAPPLVVLDAVDRPHGRLVLEFVAVKMCGESVQEVVAAVAPPPCRLGRLGSAAKLPAAGPQGCHQVTMCLLTFTYTLSLWYATHYASL